MLERILKLPAHVYHAKQLFSIPEEEDHYTAVQQPAPQPLRSALRNPSGRPTAQPRGAAGNLRRPQQHRVHYADQVATIAYSGEDEEDAASDSSLYDGPDSHKIRSRRAPASHSPADRLRREVMLRNQMSSHVAETVTAALKPPPASCSADAYLVSRTVRRTKSPPGTRVEIDLEYGTDDGQEEEAAPAVTFDPSEVVVDQMSSEWWVEGGHHTADCRRPPPATARRLIPPPHTWVCCLPIANPDLPHPIFPSFTKRWGISHGHVANTDLPPQPQFPVLCQRVLSRHKIPTHDCVTNPEHIPHLQQQPTSFTGTH